MAKRRRATSPQDINKLVFEAIEDMQKQIRQLRQAGPPAVQPDDKRFESDPFPWQLIMNHPGGHTEAWDSDNYMYYHPGYVDQITGDTIPAGFKRIGGPVIEKYKIFGDNQTGSVGDGKIYDEITKDLDGAKLVWVGAYQSTAGSGLTTIQIHNRGSQSSPRTVDMLSTRVTIDSGERSSKTAAIPFVIDPGFVGTLPNSKVRWGDEIRIDVDAIATGSKGHAVFLGFQ